MTDYKPIACVIYDELEILSMRGKHVKVTFDGDQVTEGKIVGLSTRNSEEFMKLDNGHEFRLDRVSTLLEFETNREIRLHADKC
jgi:transcriptional antiterminator Rof (Rho-off)